MSRFKIDLLMSNWTSIHKQILTIVEYATEGESIVLRTIYSHIGAVIGRRDLTACVDDREEVEEILALADKKNLCLAVYELEKLCSMPITLDAERSNCTARSLMLRGARVLDI